MNKLIFPNEKKLRITGLVSFFAIFFIFYQLLVFFYTYDNVGLLIFKTLMVAAFFAVTIWEPARWVILRVRKKITADKGSFQRQLLLVSILGPYAALIGFARTILEDRFIWTLPWKEPSFYLPMLGSNLLFILVEVAMYESFFFVQNWHNSEMEAKELKKINLQMQFEGLKVQVQPHFLFNTLNTLAGLIEIDQKSAVMFTKELAYVYRYLLAAHDTKLINLKKEFLFSQAYLFLIKTRYPEGLNIDLQFEQQDLEKYLVPPLSLQMLFENAIKHNIITKARPLTIKVSINKHRGLMTISNNLQRKEVEIKNGSGLDLLKKTFELNNMHGLRISDNGNNFSVSMPLKTQISESAYYRG